jgi:hypothetical protein
MSAMANPPLPLLATGHSQHRYLEAIFQSFIKDGVLQVYTYVGQDSALAIAETFPYERPGRHIAIVLETESDDPDRIRKIYGEAHRRLSRTSPTGELWHVALAIPDLKEWALVDDRIRQEYEKIRQDTATKVRPEQHEKSERWIYIDFSARILSLVEAQPFDLDSLKQKSRQVRELCTFIEKSLLPRPKPKPVPVTAADCF